MGWNAGRVIGMTVLGRTIGAVAVLAAGLLAASGATAEPLKVMTFNVRYASDEGRSAGRCGGR
ncbi:hypothetical protein P0F65_13805 [Sphingomonas sp. I4]